MNNQPPQGNQGYSNQLPPGGHQFLNQPQMTTQDTIAEQQQQSNLNPYAMEFRPPQPVLYENVIPDDHSVGGQMQVTQQQSGHTSQSQSHRSQPSSQPRVPSVARVSLRDEGQKVICVSKRLHAFGTLNDHIYRKKLIRIRRDFDTYAAYTPDMELSEPCDSFLCGGASLSRQFVLDGYLNMSGQTSEDGFDDFVEYNRNYRIQWNSFTETFHSNERIEEMQRLSNQFLTKPDFQVFVSSLPYIPQSKSDWRKYFREDHYKQLGTHLFVSYFGDLYMIVTYIDENQNSLEDGYRTIGLGKLTAVYPVIRNDFELSKVRSDFCLGIYFDNPNAGNEGDRLYHREGDYRLITYNVKDLQILHTKHKELFDRTQDHFAAFYVGAGAKLVVLDNYGPSPIASVAVNEQRQHNRTLIQQGGIVVFKGRLMVSMPILSQESDESKHDAIDLELMTWEQFWDNWLDTVDNTVENYTDLSLMTQPVICLGAQDSKYNSIAWNLSVEELPRSGDRRIVLQVPYGARFISIDQGKDGIDELSRRINYSMLHDSVVTHHGTQFRLPDKSGRRSIARRILNINDHLSYVVKDCPYTLEDIDLPKEFHFSKISPDPMYIDRLIDSQKLQLAVPPMYPVVCDIHWENLYIFNSLPSGYYPYKNVDQCYQHDGTETRVRLFNRKEAKITDYKYNYMKLRNQRQWQRMPHLDPENIVNVTGQRLGHQVKIYRLGVDGWMYESLAIQDVHREDAWYIYYDYQGETQSQVTSNT